MDARVLESAPDQTVLKCVYARLFLPEPDFIEYKESCALRQETKKPRRTNVLHTREGVLVEDEADHARVVCIDPVGQLGVFAWEQPGFRVRTHRSNLVEVQIEVGAIIYCLGIVQPTFLVDVLRKEAVQGVMREGGEGRA